MKTFIAVFLFLNFLPAQSVYRGSGELAGKYECGLKQLNLAKNGSFTWKRVMLSDTLIKTVYPIKAMGKWKLVSDTLFLEIDSLDIKNVITDDVFQGKIYLGKKTIHPKASKEEIPLKLLFVRKQKKFLSLGGEDPKCEYFIH